jgi:hypothetical protein
MATPANPDPVYDTPVFHAEPQRGRVAGPGDDRFPPPERVAGPGDAHDWPWNKQAGAAAPAASGEPIRVSEPAPVAPAPVAATPPEAAVPPPEDDDPNRPKKRGWWNRLTG